jgi:hypothetical protein
LFNAQRIEEPNHIADEVQQRVLVDRFRVVGLTVASHIKRDSMESRRRQRGKLMSPRVPGFWKAVAQDNKRSIALFGEMKMNPICDDGAMRNATGRLRIDRTGLSDSAGCYRADCGNKFASLHR